MTCELRIQSVTVAEGGREMSVEGEPDLEPMLVTYTPDGDSVHVSRRGRMLAVGRWDGDRFVQLRGLLRWGDQTAVTFALRIETQP